MLKIEAVQTRFAGLLEKDLPKDPLNPSEMAREYLSFAYEYSAAAALLGESMTAPRATLQVGGHATECALKAFIIAAARELPKSLRKCHSLVELGNEAERLGCRISEPDAVTLYLLHLSYSRDDATGTRFKARYPSGDTEGVVEATPDHVAVQRVCDAIVRQIEGRLAISSGSA